MKYPNNILKQVNNPIQYIGNEYNIIEKDIDNKIRVCLSFPDLYTIGMSSFGHRLLYHLFNKKFNVYAERIYAVEKDMEKLLRDNNIPILSLETHSSIKDFDFLGFTLEYELTYTNVLQILELSGIPLLSENRKEDVPIIGAGGTAAFNPLPMSRFIDVFFIGDGEEMIEDIVEITEKRKRKEINRLETLKLFDNLPYTYVPLISGTNKDVKQIITPQINSGDIIKRPLVPNTKIVHDRIVLELSRGCTRGCRFCQAGMIYRPVRQVKISNIVKNAVSQVKATGYKDITLLSLSATDYLNLPELLHTLSKELAKYKVSISLPSLRIGEINDDLFSQISAIRKSGITIAIEAVSEKLKKVINKNVSKDEIYDTIYAGIKYGWKQFKLYFMIGLPYENEDDIFETIEFLNELGNNFRSIKFHVSFSPFVPRPFTPFQWNKQDNREELNKKISMLRKNIKAKNIELDIRNSEISVLEGVFSRGDKKLGEFIFEAYKNGARLDEWTEFFDYKIWTESAKKCNINFDDYLRKHNFDKLLHWEFIKTMVSKGFYQREYMAAEKGKYTEDCRSEKCTACDACDGHIAGEKKNAIKQSNIDAKKFVRRKAKKILSRTVKKTKVLLIYEIETNLQYLSHLGIINLMSKGLRRSGLEFVYTQGFNPKIKIIYGPPKPVGVYSKMEMMELFFETKPNENILDKLNKSFPKGIHFYFMKELLSDKVSVIKKINRIDMIFKYNIDDKSIKSMDKFINSNEFIVKRIKNEKESEINIRPFIKNIYMKDNQVKIVLDYNSNGSIKFEELYKNVLGLNDINNVEIFRDKFYYEDGETIKEVKEL